MSAPAQQYRSRLLALIAALLVVAALRASYAVTMPILFAGVIVAALWPFKLFLQRWLPSWISYILTILAMVLVMGGFAVAVYLSLGQVIAVMADQWSAIEQAYASVVRSAGRWGIPLNAGIDRSRIIAAVQMLASSVYSFATYAGFIGLLVVLGLPEVPRLYDKMRVDLGQAERSELHETLVAISEQVRGYFGVTLVTSILTGIASTLWAMTMGLDLAIV